MKRTRFTEEQIIGVLKEHEAGVKTADLCRKHGVSQATFFKWKSKFGGMDISDARKLKALEDENRRLKKLLAETMLDVTMLKDLNSKNGNARCEAAGCGSFVCVLRGEPAAGVPDDWGRTDLDPLSQHPS
jgi:putative transposase